MTTLNAPRITWKCLRKFVGDLNCLTAPIAQRALMDAGEVSLSPFVPSISFVAHLSVLCFVQSSYLRVNESCLCQNEAKVGSNAVLDH